jgi:hypothetical protein
MDPARWRRKQRHRAQLMSGFALITLGALGAIAWLVVQMAKLPVAGQLAAATAESPASVSDVATGLSYRTLSPPWRNGCPMRDNPLDWTSGEGAPDGQVHVGGHTVSWYANACAGLLPKNLQSKSLAAEAANAAAAIDTDKALHHTRSTTSSQATKIGGHQAWEIQLRVRYPGEHLAWTTEVAAVVVVDREPGQDPAVFYASVPGNLSSASLTDLLSSLR